MGITNFPVTVSGVDMVSLKAALSAVDHTQGYGKEVSQTKYYPFNPKLQALF